MAAGPWWGDREGKLPTSQKQSSAERFLVQEQSQRYQKMALQKDEGDANDIFKGIDEKGLDKLKKRLSEGILDRKGESIAAGEKKPCFSGRSRENSGSPLGVQQSKTASLWGVMSLTSRVLARIEKVPTRSESARFKRKLSPTLRRRKQSAFL